MAEIIGAVAGAMGGTYLQWAANKNLQEDAQSFDERMSNTSYQRAVADMEKAGLNPMLAVQRGGASTPSSPMGSVGAPDITGALSTAQQMKRTESELATQEAQRRLITAQTMESVARADNMSQQNAESRARMPTYPASQAKTEAETGKIKEETTSASAKAYIDKQDAAQRSLVGPKRWWTDAMETVARLGVGLKKSLGLFNETPKREAERDAAPVPQPQPVPRYKGRSGR